MSSGPFDPYDKFTYNLSILCVDGAIEGCIGNRARVLQYLKDHDHEGSTINLVKHDYVHGSFESIDNPDDIYKELGWQLSALISTIPS